MRSPLPTRGLATLYRHALGTLFSDSEMVNMWELLRWGWDPQLVWGWTHAPQGGPEAPCPHSSDTSWLKHPGALPRLETDPQGPWGRR